VLAETIAAALQEAKDIGAAGPLNGYVDARRRDQQTMALFTDNLNWVFANPLASVAWARNTGLLAMEFLPSLRQAFLKRNLGLAGTLPRLARGLPLA
jgi:2-octaprenyl-6-methoxyphenol hydroxylase